MRIITRILQLAPLDLQLEAYITRISQLQARLRFTVDTLDTMQNAHIQELATHIQGSVSLSEGLERYAGHVRAIEVEKDDLKDAVLQLIERGLFV
jgi:hypothetical protein